MTPIGSLVANRRNSAAAHPGVEQRYSAGVQPDHSSNVADIDQVAVENRIKKRHLFEHGIAQVACRWRHHGAYLA